MAEYEVYNNAGVVAYNEWHASGVRVLAIDVDNTLTDCNGKILIPEVVDGLRSQDLNDFRVSLVSNNASWRHIHRIGDQLADTLGIEKPFCTCHGNKHRRKPNTAMGFVIANHFDIDPDQLGEKLGVVGDRRLVDVEFGFRLGAAAIALCDKVGKGDVPLVPLLRMYEKRIVEADILRGIATDRRGYMQQPSRL